MPVTADIGDFEFTVVVVGCGGQSHFHVKLNLVEGGL